VKDVNDAVLGDGHSWFLVRPLLLLLPLPGSVLTRRCSDWLRSWRIDVFSANSWRNKASSWLTNDTFKQQKE